MKTNFKINTSSFTFDKEISRTVTEEKVTIDVSPVEIPSISIEGDVEYSISEMVELWQLTKTIAKESPEVIKDFVINLFNVQAETTQYMHPKEEATNESC